MKLTLSTLAFAVVTFALVNTVTVRPETAKPRASSSAERIKRGEYLVTMAGCHDCHSPKSDAQMTPDAGRPLSGRPATTPPPLQGEGEIRASLDFTAFAGPWGNSFAANLTPDPETGLGGRYTEAGFVQTIRTGKKPEGEMLAPPMPWTVYRNMTDEDLKAVYAYLTTVKPVKNFVRSSVAPAKATR
jgi:mono/diheme cytochrome c family protein